MSKKKYVKKIIHPTDPDYLDAFYSGWGAGQSVTHRQTTDSSKGQTEKLLEPTDFQALKHSEPLKGDK